MLTIVPQPADPSVSPEVAAGAASTRTEAEVRALREPPKFCVNCRHYSPSKSMPDNPEFARCSSPRAPAPTINLVTGEPKPGLIYCSSFRNAYLSDVCGPEGAWFEAVSP